jgi:predicted MFS family arabinose efflux permease
VIAPYSGAIRTKADVALLVAGSVAFSVSTMFSAMKPVLIARLVEQVGYSPTMAGLGAAMPFIGGVFSSLFLPLILRRFSADAVLMAFSLGLTAFEAVNAFSYAVPILLLASQLAAGVCGGIMLGLVSRQIAISGRPEQNFGIVDMVGVLMMSFMIALVGAAVDWGGLQRGFLAVSGLCAVFAGLVYFSRHGLPEPSSVGLGHTSGRLNIGWRAVAVIAMGVVFMTFSGVGFAFMFTAARKLGFSYQDAGTAIGVILFLSATGCLAGGWCAAKVGPRPALLAAFALCALGWHLALHTHFQIIFILALGPAIFALQFCFPVILALAGSFDADGRLAAIAAPLIVSGFAWAAILAGVVVDHWGLAALPIVTELGMVLCAILLFASTSVPRASAVDPIERFAAPQNV